MKCPVCHASNVSLHGITNFKYWAFCEDCGTCSPSINECDIKNISLPILVVLSKKWHKKLRGS